MRLTRPTGELVPPNEFLAIAEETGLIVTIGAGVLDAACAQLAKWRVQFGDSAPERVGINVSSRQLAHPTLSTRSSVCSASAGLAPSMLSLEFDELAISRSPIRARSSIEQLRSMGVTVGIDDFGSGDSSLTSLKALPLDYVKLDRIARRRARSRAERHGDRPRRDRSRQHARSDHRSRRVSRPRNNSSLCATWVAGSRRVSVSAAPQPAAVLEHTLFTPTTVV